MASTHTNYISYADFFHERTSMNHEANPTVKKIESFYPRFLSTNRKLANPQKYIVTALYFFPLVHKIASFLGVFHVLHIMFRASEIFAE